jgi:hypothetical protein
MRSCRLAAKRGYTAKTIPPDEQRGHGHPRNGRPGNRWLCGKAKTTAAATMASPADALASETITGAFRAASASGPPNDTTATPANAHPPAGRVSSALRGRPPLSPVTRAMKVINADSGPALRA